MLRARWPYGVEDPARGAARGAAAGSVAGPEPPGARGATHSLETM